MERQTERNHDAGKTAIAIILAIIILIIIAFIILSTGRDPAAQDVNTTEDRSPPLSAGGIELSFCDLVDCGLLIARMVEGSTDAACAFYDINHPALIAALKEADARLIIDEESPDEGIGERRYGNGLMHDKFCVINRSVVIVSSYNPMEASWDDYNNLLVIRSPPLAEQFLAAHGQLLSERKMPSEKTSFIHDGALIESYHCPQDGCQERILAAIRSANKTIALALFSYTDVKVEEAIERRMANGITVRGVIESSGRDEFSQADELMATGADVILEQTKRLQHNKVIVIDDEIVVTGSYNPTKSAYLRNEEVLLIIHDRGIAQAYSAMVARIYDETKKD